MVKRILPSLFIFAVWVFFCLPFFAGHRIPYPSDLQVNSADPWASYSSFWGAVHNPAQPDVIGQIYPWKKLVIDSWKIGAPPLWNPYVFSGSPLLANYQSGSFSPLNFLFFMFSFNTAWGLAILSPPLLAGLFMYLFIKSLKLNDFSAVIASLSFMFCGFITTWMSYGTLTLAISFLPLALYAIEKFEEEKGNKFLLLLFLSFPLSFFSGHFQISIYFAIFVISYVLFKYLETRSKQNFLYYISISFLGILAASIQIIPSLELYLYSVRSTLFQKISAVSILQFPTIISPDFYGNPVTRNNFLANYAEQSSFFGTIPFFLALFAIFSKNKRVYFFLVMAVASLIFSINSPITDLLVHFKIPVLSTSSLSRVLVLFSFSGSILAAYGTEKLKSDLENEKYKDIRMWILVSLLVFMLVFGLIGLKIINPLLVPIAIKNMVLPVLLFIGLVFAVGLSIFRKKLILVSLLMIVALVTFDMLRFSTKWQTFADAKLIYANTTIVNELLKLNDIYRIQAPWGQEVSNYYHVPGTGGYDPLYINRYGEFIESLNDGKAKSSGRVGTALPLRGKYLPKFIDLLGIKYVVVKTRDIKKPWSFPIDQYKTSLSQVYKEKDFVIFENKNVLPRAFIVGNYTVQTNGQKIIDSMDSPSFNPRQTVILEKDPGIKQANLNGNAKIIKYTPNEVNIEANPNHNGLLILTDNYYPGWKALVNGRPVEVRRADYTFRAVSIPAGKSNIKFYYQPDSFKWGALLSLLSILGIGLLLGRRWYTNTHGRK